MVADHRRHPLSSLNLSAGPEGTPARTTMTINVILTLLKSATVTPNPCNPNPHILDPLAELRKFDGVERPKKKLPPPLEMDQFEAYVISMKQTMTSDHSEHYLCASFTVYLFSWFGVKGLLQSDSDVAQASRK